MLRLYCSKFKIFVKPPPKIAQNLLKKQGKLLYSLPYPHNKLTRK